MSSVGRNCSRARREAVFYNALREADEAKASFFHGYGGMRWPRRKCAPSAPRS